MTRAASAADRATALRSTLDTRSPAYLEAAEAMTAKLAPIAETREIVTQAAGLIYWKDRLGIKVTTEIAAADPDDEGFALWFARDRVEIARSSDGTVRISVPKWHWDRSEIEGLVALPGRTPIEA